jgi:hypothetical protein
MLHAFSILLALVSLRVASLLHWTVCLDHIVELINKACECEIGDGKM